MSSSLPATVNLSINEFARHGSLHGNAMDGWGAAFYQGKDVFLIREASPAADSNCIRVIRRNKVASCRVIAHIRRATQGPVCLANTQPFARELGGRMHVFVHNGDLMAIRTHTDFPLGRFLPIGDTDSEYAFCALLQRMEALWLDSSVTPSIQTRLSVFQDFSIKAHELGPANFIYSDSDALFLHSHKRRSNGGWGVGLHVLSRSCLALPERKNRGGVNLHLTDEEQHVFLAASVPLSDESWIPMHTGECIAVRGGNVVA